MEPINYTAGAQNPMQAFQDALTLGSNIQAQRLKAEQANAAAAANEHQQMVFKMLSDLNKPGVTAADYLKASMFLDKDSAEAMRKGVESMQVEERQATLTDTAQIFAAFEGGRTDIAVQLIRKQAAAERSAGNEDGAKIAEAWATMAEGSEDGAKAVKNMLGMSIAMLPGGDKAIEGASKYAQSKRDEALFPMLFEQRKADLAKAKTDAEKAAIELKFAEKLEQAKLDKNAADAEAAKLTLANLPAQLAAELSAAESAADIAAINAKYAERKAAAETKLAELGVDFKSTEFKTYEELKKQELAAAKSEAEIAAIEAKYADPLQAAQVLLTQGNAQATQISLKTLEEAKQLELSAAKTAGEIAAVEAKYAERKAAAETKLAELGVDFKSTEFKTYEELKKQELAAAKSEAEIAAIEAKYADPLQAAQVLLAQGKATELTTILLTLGDEKKQALAKATSEASKAAIDAEFALRVSQASLDQQLATLGLTKDQADKTKVDKAIAEAKEAREVKVFPNEEARIAAEVKIAQSKATIAEIDAKYAEKIKIAELEQMAQDLGLTIAQKNKAIVEGTKVSAETSKLLMEAENLKKNGGLDAQAVFGLENTVRKEFNSRTIQVNELRQTYDKIASSAKSNTPAGDVALVFAFMRMLDPTSVVRESEFAVAQDTTGLYGKLSLLYPKLVSGQRLTDDQRNNFVEMSGKYMEASLKHEARVKNDLSIVVKNYGLNPANVFGVSSPDTAASTVVEVDY